MLQYDHQVLHISIETLRTNPSFKPSIITEAVRLAYVTVVNDSRFDVAAIKKIRNEQLQRAFSSASSQQPVRPSVRPQSVRTPVRPLPPYPLFLGRRVTTTTLPISVAPQFALSLLLP